MRSNRRSRSVPSGQRTITFTAISTMFVFFISGLQFFNPSILHSFLRLVYGRTAVAVTTSGSGDCPSILLMRLAERPYRHGLSNLPGTIDDKWLMIGIPVPLFQITINLSFKQIHNDNHIFWLQIYNKNHIFRTFLPSFFTFSTSFLLSTALDLRSLATNGTQESDARTRKIAPLSLSSLRLSPSAPDLLFPSASDLWFQALPRAFLCRFQKFS